MTATSTRTGGRASEPGSETTLVRWFGGAAGPVLVAAVATQAVTRDGFRLADHPLSLLALGPNGWIQTATFLAVGASFASAGWLATRAGITTSRWALWLIVVFGASMIVAGLFPADPWNRFPPGAVEETTIIGVIHNAAAGIGGLSLIAAAGLSARFHHQRGHTKRRSIAATAAAASLILGAAGSGSQDFRIAFAGGAVSWLWASYELAISPPETETVHVNR